MEEYIKSHFHYYPDTGEIVRDDRKNSNGSLDKDGYLILKIKGKQHKAHRVAWLLYYGSFPQKEIDHINRKRTDNRICNLREATRLQNVLNTTRKPSPSTGICGIYITNAKGLKKKYTVSLKGKHFRFYTIEEAIKFKNEHNEQGIY